MFYASFPVFLLFRLVWLASRSFSWCFTLISINAEYLLNFLYSCTRNFFSSSQTFFLQFSRFFSLATFLITSRVSSLPPFTLFKKGILKRFLRRTPSYFPHHHHFPINFLSSSHFLNFLRSLSMSFFPCLCCCFSFLGEAFSANAYSSWTELTHAYCLLLCHYDSLPCIHSPSADYFHLPFLILCFFFLADITFY